MKKKKKFIIRFIANIGIIVSSLSIIIVSAIYNAVWTSALGGVYLGFGVMALVKTIDDFVGYKDEQKESSSMD